MPQEYKFESERQNACCPDCHQTLSEIREFLPAMRRAAAFLDNPVAKYKDAMKRGKRSE